MHVLSTEATDIYTEPEFINRGEGVGRVSPDSVQLGAPSRSQAIRMFLWHGELRKLIIGI